MRWLDLAGMQHLKQSEVVTVGDFFLKNLIVTQLTSLGRERLTF
jgi:hypothetical protein